MTAGDPAHPPRAGLGPLRPCPFCGGEARLEPGPWLEGSVRIACGNDACGVRPGTEYLLACYLGELRDAWNARPGDGEGAEITRTGSGTHA